MILLGSLLAGAAETLRLKSREKELLVFADALSMLKSAAAYTAGDLYALLSLCSGNVFLAGIKDDADLPTAWNRAARAFFTYRRDAVLAEAFIEGYGRADLSGQLAYMTLFETRTAEALAAARRNAAAKGKLYTAFGAFSGVVAVLILL